MTDTPASRLARHYEVHACKAGITNDDIDGDYLNSGSVVHFDFVLHVFRDTPDGVDGIQAILVQNLEGQDHWLAGEPFGSKLEDLFPSSASNRPSRSFMDLVRMALHPNLLANMFNSRWIVERVGDDYCGEINMAELDNELIANLGTGPALAVFSNYAECEMPLHENGPPDLSKFYPDYIDQAEAVRLYLGPPW